MNVSIDMSENLPGAKWPGSMRVHPWHHWAENPSDLYYDFKNGPELIHQAMSEWKPWAHYEAVQTFYRLLAWLNGSESPFETNHSSFSGPYPNNQKDTHHKEVKCSGNLMFFFDFLLCNISNESERWFSNDPELPYLPAGRNIKWLIEILHKHLQQAQPDLEWGWTKCSFYPTEYLLNTDRCYRFGHEIEVHFWAFGDTEVEAMDNLEHVFQAIEESLRNTAQDVRETIWFYAPRKETPDTISLPEDSVIKSSESDEEPKGIPSFEDYQSHRAGSSKYTEFDLD